MATTARGHIEQLPSGSFRVHVYAGTDPVSGKPRRLKQTCPDEAAAAAALGRLLIQADGGRFPDREATLGQALGTDRLSAATIFVTGYLCPTDRPAFRITRHPRPYACRTPSASGRWRPDIAPRGSHHGA
jgi:hypothetical protein